MNRDIPLEAVKGALHQALFYLHTNGPIYYDYGICTNAQTVLDKLSNNVATGTFAEQTYAEAKRRRARLVHFYGAISSIPDIRFPIEGSADAYESNDQKWDSSTEHGKARWAMLDTLIDLNGGASV